jgi:NAD-dependent SIR2 family protein deacetylase
LIIGVSAESGVPTFRDEGGLWRNFKAQVKKKKINLVNLKYSVFNII